MGFMFAAVAVAVKQTSLQTYSQLSIRGVAQRQNPSYHDLNKVEIWSNTTRRCNDLDGHQNSLPRESSPRRD